MANSTHADYPYKFGDTQILWPLTWDESFTTIEDVQQSEAGTDDVAVTRDDKLSVSASFKVSAYWLGIFKTYKAANSFVLSRYDGTTQGYDTRTVRMRGFTQKRIRWSENVLYDGVPVTPNSNEDPTIAAGGLWEVSFTLEEF